MSVFDSPSYDHHEIVAFHEDPPSGLRAIIAVHDTRPGPALGGCRMYPYHSEAQALEDVLRLSRGMTYKSALAGLPLGGGKSVIVGNPHTEKTPQLLRAMGDFVNRLGGRYITAEDSGTDVEDMKIIRERTSHVSGVLEGSQFNGDPSPYTAYGVYCGIKVAVGHKYGLTCLEGLSVALQGAGSVGRHLAKRLIDEGARVYVADVNPINLRAAAELGAEVVDVDSILGLDVDILAPCAMGAVINADTVEHIRAGIIAGAANNQLATPREGKRLRERGILYAPDFVINAGGIIDVYYQRTEGNSEKSRSHVEHIATSLAAIFSRADSENIATASVAELLAREILERKGAAEHAA